jgi:hypothetical protein
MQSKPIKPEYQAWRKRIEGQLRHAMNEHPEWFNVPTREIKDRAIRSIGKRVIGEIVAGTPSGSNKDEGETLVAFNFRSFIRETELAIKRAVGGTSTANRLQPSNKLDDKE